MHNNRNLHTDYLTVPLIAFMLLTRFHYFDDSLLLPDASLAVFIDFAGFALAKLIKAIPATADNRKTA